jgi:hypothetical protein
LTLVALSVLAVEFAGFVGFVESAEGLDKSTGPADHYLAELQKILHNLYLQVSIDLDLRHSMTECQPSTHQ